MTELAGPPLEFPTVRPLADGRSTPVQDEAGLHLADLETGLLTPQLTLQGAEGFDWIAAHPRLR